MVTSIWASLALPIMCCYVSLWLEAAETGYPSERRLYHQVRK
jgi:hypothetical protein